MAYLSAQQLFDRYGEDKCRDLANRDWPQDWDDTQITAAEDSTIADAIESAEATVNSYLAGRYNLDTLAANPKRLIQDVTARLSYCVLAEGKNEAYLKEDGNFYPIRAGAIAQLRDLSSGKAQLEGTPATTSIENSVRVAGRDRIFTSDSLRNY